MNLAIAFAQTALDNADKTAIFWGDSEIPYKQLQQIANGVAEALRSSFGVTKGQRVGIWLKNRPEFASALFGVLQAGAVAVPINNFLKPAEVSFILQDAGIEVLITDASSMEAMEKLRAACPGLKELRVEQFAALFTAPELPEMTENDLAVIIYTSGTTGHPKGAMLSHGNILANVESCRVVLAALGEDRFLLALPMFHSFMLTVCVFLPLLIGGSFVLVKTLHPPKNIVMEMIQRRATIVPAVPQFLPRFDAWRSSHAIAGACVHQRRRAAAGGNPQRVYQPFSDPAFGRLRLERGQPGLLVQPHSRPVESRFDWRAYQRRGNVCSRRSRQNPFRRRNR